MLLCTTFSSCKKDDNEKTSINKYEIIGKWSVAAIYDYMKINGQTLQFQETTIFMLNSTQIILIRLNGIKIIKMALTL